MDQLLKEIASNFWFEWNPEAKTLFSDFNPQLWTLCNRNPYRFLAYRLENPLEYEKRFAELITDPDYLARFEKVKTAWQSYINPSATWIREHHPEFKDKTVAYFSMEYGIETIKNYSGGLGILSGDHIRGASDLGLKFVAVGLFYLQGYYEQEITKDGEMRVTYDSIVPPRSSVREYLPLEPVKKNGSLDDLIVRVPIGGRQVNVKVWRARIGRSELLLLDTNSKENLVHDRHITRRLYASEKQHQDERSRRFEQEMILGIGGAMAIHEAGYDPHVYHLNEGHAALAILEIVRYQAKKDGTNFKAARYRAGAKIGFTSHTPVAEGNERFDENLAREYLVPYLDQFASKEDQQIVFNYARNRDNFFDMTKFALMFVSGFRNGVSQLHGAVCRDMWAYAWGNKYDEKINEVPIGAITNGVHVPYWQSPEIRTLIQNAGGVKNIGQIPDEKLWQAKAYRKIRMIVKVREHAAYHLLRTGLPPEEVLRKTQSWLDPDAFMIGFARRFAGYKRVTWFLEDEERLFAFLESSYKKYGKPIQILFAGKPHPDNEEGKQQIKQIYKMSIRLNERAEARNFKAQIFFIEAYDIDLARRLVSGVDIWLNNPIRPLEASGTSGMKAGMNGTLNVSIPDGWVGEGIKTGENGWLFGKGSVESSKEDREELFHLLENEILPIYFERPDPKLNYSPRWLGLIKNSIQTITEQFSVERMLIEYVEKMYLPAVSANQAPAVSRSSQ